MLTFPREGDVLPKSIHADLSAHTKPFANAAPDIDSRMGRASFFQNHRIHGPRCVEFALDSLSSGGERKPGEGPMAEGWVLVSISVFASGRYSRCSCPILHGAAGNLRGAFRGLRQFLLFDNITYAVPVLLNDILDVVFR